MDKVALLQTFLSDNSAIIHVRLTRVRGSSPRAVGDEMLVSAAGCLGSIGGGRLEYMAIAQARDLLHRAENSMCMDVALGAALGQCCGGRVELILSRLRATDKVNLLTIMQCEQEQYVSVFIFGAGHVGKALARNLLALPLNVILVDTRSEQLAQCDINVRKELTPLPESMVDTAPAGSAFVVLTYDHGLDFLIVLRALQRGDGCYVGMIGSASKRAAFLSWVRRQGAAVDDRHLICPIGSDYFYDKRPEVIAQFVASEILIAALKFIGSMD